MTHIIQIWIEDGCFWLDWDVANSKGAALALTAFISRPW